VAGVALKFQPLDDKRERVILMLKGGEDRLASLTYKLCESRIG
jgi:hypothetical protein